MHNPAGRFSGRVMTDTTRNQTDLVYFQHTIESRVYGGWYRLLPAGCIEVLAIGLMQTLALDGRRPEEVACGVLAEFVRARASLGQPVPNIPASLASAEPGHKL
jgi:hypothetical protein